MLTCMMMLLFMAGFKTALEMDFIDCSGLPRFFKASFELMGQFTYFYIKSHMLYKQQVQRSSLPNQSLLEEV